MDESDGFATDSDRQDKVSDEPSKLKSIIELELVINPLFLLIMLGYQLCSILVDLENEGDREWKQLNSKDLGLSSSMIAKSTRKVLNGLKSKGW